jgi:hypothetical protein
LSLKEKNCPQGDLQLSADTIRVPRETIELIPESIQTLENNISISWHLNHSLTLYGAEWSSGWMPRVPVQIVVLRLTFLNRDRLKSSVNNVWKCILPLCLNYSHWIITELECNDHKNHSPELSIQLLDLSSLCASFQFNFISFLGN